MLLKVLNKLLGNACRAMNVVHLHAGPANSKKRILDVTQPYYWNYQYKNAKDLSQHLLDNILYRDDYIVAFNKPNGLPMFSQTYEKSRDTEQLKVEELLSLESCKATLAKELGVSELHGIFLQNRLYSGVMVFCFSKEPSESLSRYFKCVRSGRRPTSSYNAICVGRHYKDSGTKIIRSVQMLINGHLLSVEDENLKKNRNNRISTSLVKYNTLSKSECFYKCHMSHLEILTSSAKWDALEMFAVRRLTPFLGDHKYSSRVRTVLDKPILVKHDEALPEDQDLPRDLCHLLGVEERHSGDIPLHVHCSKLILPRLYKTKSGPKFARECLQNCLGTEQELDLEMEAKTNIIIDAPLPQFFEETMKRLQLTCNANKQES